MDCKFIVGQRVKTIDNKLDFIVEKVESWNSGPITGFFELLYKPIDSDLWYREVQLVSYE